MARKSRVDLLPFATLILLGCITCPAIAQTTAPDAPPETTFRSEVTEVRVTFSTTDHANRVIANILPSDFAIVDQDRVIRDFRSFTRSEYSRLDVMLLVDASESTTRRFHQELSNVVQLINQNGVVPEESFSVVSFRDLKPTMLCQGNCRALDMGAQFPAVSSGGQTPLYDSIVLTSRLLARRSDVHTRKILILFSDGADTISVNSLNDAIDSALQGDVAIYTVDVSDAPHVYPGTLVMRGLAANTGGRYFPLETGASKVLDAILEDFHSTFTVAYKLPTHAAGFHLVRILPTHDPTLQFHCRRGYYYPEN